MNDLTRFKTAQASAADGYETAMSELRAGHKRSHWIWYVFPQIAGLGSSSMSAYFAVRGRREAEAYLRDETLRTRLLEAVDVLAAHLTSTPPLRLDVLMGSEVDALKLVSSMTLFGAVASDLASRESNSDVAALAREAGTVLDAAARHGYERCRFTLAQLARDLDLHT